MIKKIFVSFIMSGMILSSCYAKDLVCVKIGNLTGSIMSQDRKYVAMQDNMKNVDLTFAIDPDSSTVDINDGNPVKLNKITSTIFERTVILPEDKGTILTLWTLSTKDKKVFMNENKIGDGATIKTFVGDILSYSKSESCYSNNK